MQEPKQQFKKIGYLVVTPIAFLLDEDGELLGTEPMQQVPVYRPFGLAVEELVKLKNRGLEAKE